MVLILAAVWGRLAQDNEAEQYFSFKEGTVWTFDADFAGEKRKVVDTVSKVEKGKVVVEYDVFKGNDPGATASDDFAWYVKDGFWVQAMVEDDDKLVPRWNILKLGSKKGDTWTSPYEGTATHLGFEDVTVPAGVFKNCLHIRIKDEATFDLYFAPNVGMVKHIRDDGKKRDVTELKRFKPGK